MQIINIKIDSLKPYKRNPRKNDQAVDAVAQSIKEFGFKVPVIIDKNNEIVAGHTRLKAAQKLGLTEAPCIVADDLTPEQIKAFRLVDNKTAELAEWDEPLLFEEIAELDMSGFDLDWGAQKVGEESKVIEDTPPEVEEQTEPICKIGDIWQLGKHRLICGDSTDKATIERLMDGEKADIWLTDPPYNVALGNHDSPEQARQRRRRTDGLLIMNDAMPEEDFLPFLEKSFEIAFSILKDGGAFYIWHADNESLNFRLALKNIGATLRQTLIWNKSHMTLGRQDYQWKHEPCLYGWKDGASHKWYSDRKQSTVLDFAKPSVSKEHPTMKPVALMAYQIENSTKKGDIVFDGFGGSGSTLIACEQTRRKCYMAELDTRYADVIIKRYENLTRNKAVKINV